MVNFILATTALIGAASASMLDIVDQYNNLEIPPTFDNNRALLKQDMGQIDEYGCWCYFEQDHGRGRGHPVDEIDQFCKTLHDGYTCIIMDSEAMGNPCVPWEIPYNSATSAGIPTGMSMDNLISECDVQNNADTCASWTCRVEGWFLVQWLRYTLVDGGFINQPHRHANGFDWTVECPISEGIKSDKACCGDYPLRFPFKTYNGARDCCVAHTFNTNYMNAVVTVP